MRGFEANGAAIRELRKLRGWKQEDLAAAANCAVRTIGSAEHGKAIDPATLARIAAALEVSLPDVLIADTAKQQRNIQTVREWVRLWTEGDLEGILKLHHPETTLELPGAGSMPGVPENPKFQGLDELREHLAYVFTILQLQEVLEEQFDAKGNLVFHRNESVFQGCETGKSAVTKFYNEFHFDEEGLIIHRMTISELSGHRHVLGME